MSEDMETFASSTENKPIMLWHSGFYDHPLDGLALYKGVKVWFTVSDDGEWKKIWNLDQLKALDGYYYDIENTSDDIFKGEMFICKYTLYKLYEIPDKCLIQHEDKHKLFQEFVGYHTDHDPLIYKPFNNWEMEFENNKFYNTEHPKIDYNPLDHKYLGEFRSIDFINYYLPKI